MTLLYWTSGSGSIELEIETKDVRTLSAPGPRDDDVEAALLEPYIAAQLETVDPDALRRHLREFGAWDDDELADHDANLARLLWTACCDLGEELKQ